MSIDELQSLLRQAAAKNFAVAETNFRIGRAVDQLCGDQGADAITEVAAALSRSGGGASAEFLFNAFRVYRSIRSDDLLREIKTKVGARFSWGFLVHKCTAVPEGDTPEARLFWEQQFSLIERSAEQTKEAVERLMEHSDKIPESLRTQAEGVLSAIGQTDRRPVRRILHAADEHFDDTDLLADVIRSGRFIVDRAREEQPDLIVSAGDILNCRQSHDSPAIAACIDFVRELAGIAPLLILKGTTSHDGVSIKFLESLQTRHAVYVAETAEMVGLSDGRFTALSDYQPGLDALLFALPPASKARLVAEGNGDSQASMEQLLRQMFLLWSGYSRLARRDGVLTAVVAHGTVRGSVTSTGQKMVGRDIEFSIEDLLSVDADFALLGHIHKAQSWDDVRAYYAGSIAKLNVGEREDKGFWIHEKDGAERTSRFIIVPTREIISVDFESLPDVGALPEIVPGSIVRICYSVSEEDVHSVDEGALRRAALEHGAAEVRIEKTVVPKQMVRAAGISRLTSLVEKVGKWAETTGTPLTESLRAKAALIGEPRDLVFAELGLEQPGKGRRS